MTNFKSCYNYSFAGLILEIRKFICRFCLAEAEYIVIACIVSCFEGVLSTVRAARGMVKRNNNFLYIAPQTAGYPR